MRSKFLSVISSGNFNKFALFWWNYTWNSIHMNWLWILRQPEIRLLHQIALYGINQQRNKQIATAAIIIKVFSAFIHPSLELSSVNKGIIIYIPHHIAPCRWFHSSRGYDYHLSHPQIITEAFLSVLACLTLSPRYASALWSNST